jgi:hypothetical protein
MRTALVAALALAALAQDDPTRDLLDAAKAGDTGRVQAILQAGAKIDAAGRNGRTALMIAAQHGHADTVKALLAAGADPARRDESGNTAYSLTLFEPAGRGNHDPVLKLLPRPLKLRLSVITGWTAKEIVSSCFEQRTQVLQQIGLMKPDQMMLKELQAYVKSFGRGVAQLAAIDAKGVEPLSSEPAHGVDGVVTLEIEPGSACAGGSGDNLTFTVEMRVLRASDGKELETKRIGGGVKGLRSLKVENAAQRRPVYEKWLKEASEAIYWDAIQTLMRQTG